MHINKIINLINCKLKFIVNHGTDSHATAAV